MPLERLIADELGERAEALQAEDRALRIDEILGRCAAAQDDLTDDQRVLAELGQQALLRVH